MYFLQDCEAGNTYITVVVDYFTCWMEVHPIPNQEAVIVVYKLVMNDSVVFTFLNNCTLTSTNSFMVKI